MLNQLKRIYLFCFCACLLSIVSAQNAQNEFLEAKRLFRNGDYINAKSAFAGLFDNESFGLYSIFYAGLCSFNLDDVDAANSIWRQIPKRNSSWDEIDEVYFWLMRSSYEIGDFEPAIRYSELFSKYQVSDLPERLGSKYLAEAGKDDLIDLNLKFPENRSVAKALITKLDPDDIGDAEILKGIIADFDFTTSEYLGESLPVIKKESYNIGVLLPFMFDGLSNPEKSISNRVIMDLYEGMLLAEEALQGEGISVELYPFDTKRNKEITAEAIKEFEDIDLILGPLFGGPIEAANEYSQAQKINMFNPVSSNVNAVKDNNFGYLLKPSFETMAQALANHAIGNEENKNVLVYYSKNQRDSLFALVYKDLIEADSFNVIEFRSLDNLSGKQVLDSLTSQYEEYIATLDEVDSLMQISGRFIKEKKPDQEDSLDVAYALVRLDEEGEPGDSLIYYEMKFDVVPDSIGHIMIASRDNNIINNLIGAIEARPDSIGLYGYGNWANFKVVNYNQLERLEIRLADPEFVDTRKYAYEEVSNLIKDTYQCPASSYHFLGYEAVYYLGRMLHKYGKYFQNDFLIEGQTPGKILSGFRYGLSRDNQVVPIVTLKNSTLVPVYD